jgi:hypothetical protein
MPTLQEETNMNSSNLEITTSPPCPLLSRVIVLVAIAVTCVAFLPRVHAVTPPPDGAYPGANTAEGYNALFSLTNGVYNTAIGDQALHDNTTGSSNTATGKDAMVSNNIGDYNTAAGFGALANNTTGSYNTANGSEALEFGFTGHNNTATGSNTLRNDADGSYNTASGGDALRHNFADNNTATGYQALYLNDAGTQNTATGVGALYSNTSGNYNTATGLSALQSNTNGNSNTADGINALVNNRTGSLNVALGDRAGLNLTTGSNNIVIGAGVLGSAGDANTIRIGKSGTQQRTFVAGIYGKTANGGVGVFINSNGQLGTVQSSAKYKQDIKPMDKASEAILALKPVTFCYKKEIDPEATPQFGLVAEDVEKVNPDLVVRDDQGKAFTVRYEAVNAMLLNEFLKEHRKVQELEATVAEQKKGMQVLTRRLEEQAAEIHKISTKIDLNEAGSRTIASN